MRESEEEGNGGGGVRRESAKVQQIRGECAKINEFGWDIFSVDYL